MGCLNSTIINTPFDYLYGDDRRQINSKIKYLVQNAEFTKSFITYMTDSWTVPEVGYSEDSKINTSVMQTKKHAINSVEFLIDALDFSSVPYSKFQCYRGYQIYEKYLMHGSVKYVRFSENVLDECSVKLFEYQLGGKGCSQEIIDSNIKSEEKCVEAGGVEEAVKKVETGSESNGDSDDGMANPVSGFRFEKDSGVFDGAIAEVVDYLEAEVYPEFIKAFPDVTVGTLDASEFVVGFDCDYGYGSNASIGNNAPSNISIDVPTEFSPKNNRSVNRLLFTNAPLRSDSLRKNPLPTRNIPKASNGAKMNSSAEALMMSNPRCQLLNVMMKDNNLLSYFRAFLLRIGAGCYLDMYNDVKDMSNKLDIAYYNTDYEFKMATVLYFLHSLYAKYLAKTSKIMQVDTSATANQHCREVLLPSFFDNFTPRFVVCTQFMNNNGDDGVNYENGFKNFESDIYMSIAANLVDCFVVSKECLSYCEVGNDTNKNLYPFETGGSVDEDFDGEIRAHFVAGVNSLCHKRNSDAFIRSSSASPLNLEAGVTRNRRATALLGSDFEGSSASAVATRESDVGQGAGNIIPHISTPPKESHNGEIYAYQYAKAPVLPCCNLEKLRCFCRNFQASDGKSVDAFSTFIRLRGKTSYLQFCYSAYLFTITFYVNKMELLSAGKMLMDKFLSKNSSQYIQIPTEIRTEMYGKHLNFGRDLFDNATSWVQTMLKEQYWKHMDLQHDVQHPHEGVDAIHPSNDDVSTYHPSSTLGDIAPITTGTSALIASPKDQSEQPLDFGVKTVVGNRRGSCGVTVVQRGQDPRICGVAVAPPSVQPFGKACDNHSSVNAEEPTKPLLLSAVVKFRKRLSTFSLLHRRIDPNASAPFTLNEVINNRQCCSVFKEYLERENAAYLLTFMSEVEECRGITVEAFRKIYYKQIYYKYVHPYAILLVPIEEASRKLAVEGMHKCLPSSFRCCVDNVLKYMNIHHYPRMLKSPEASLIADILIQQNQQSKAAHCRKSRISSLTSSSISPIVTANPGTTVSTSGSDVSKPRRLSLQSNVLENKICPTDMLDLRSVLQCQSTARFFKDFCVRSYCAESLYFWLDVENFQSMPGSCDFMYRTASKIYQKYIEDKAKQQVNVPHCIFQQVRENMLLLQTQATSGNGVGNKFLQQHRYLFKPAQDEVFNMMKMDAFAKFKESKEFVWMVEGTGI